jgi:hypothetical protein
MESDIPLGDFAFNAHCFVEDELGYSKHTHNMIDANSTKSLTRCSLQRMGEKSYGHEAINGSSS